MSDWLDGEEFYNVMQSYRMAPVTDQAAVCAAFETVKEAIRQKSLVDAARWATLMGHIDSRRLALQGWYGDGYYCNSLAVTSLIDNSHGNR